MRLVFDFFLVKSTDRYNTSCLPDGPLGDTYGDTVTPVLDQPGHSTLPLKRPISSIEIASDPHGRRKRLAYSIDNQESVAGWQPSMPYKSTKDDISFQRADGTISEQGITPETTPYDTFVDMEHVDMPEADDSDEEYCKRLRAVVHTPPPAPPPVREPSIA